MTPHQADADIRTDIRADIRAGGGAGGGDGAPYRRPVSPTERLYLAAGDARGAMALRIVVEGDGVPDPEHFRAALARAAASCPGSRLVRTGTVWRAEGPSPQVRYGTPRAGAYADSAPGTVELPARPPRRAEPPGCEVLIVPGADGKAPTTVVFSASHALMDGHGALTWVREVFRALRGEPARPAPDTDTDAGLLRRLGSSGPRPMPGPPRRSPLGTGSGDRRPLRTLWLRRTLPGRHPALTARLAQALTDAARLDTRVMVPVDLRRHRPGIAATGNLSLPLFLDLRPGEDWTAAHTRLLTALAERRELAAGFETSLVPLPLPVTAGLLRTAQAVASRTDRHLASAVVSHLGRLDLAELSGGGFTASTAYALPVHAPLVPLSLVAAESGEATEITLGVRGGGRDLAARAAELLDTVLAGLEAADATAVRPGPGTTTGAGARAAAPQVAQPTPTASRPNTPTLPAPSPAAVPAPNPTALPDLGPAAVPAPSLAAVPAPSSAALPDLSPAAFLAPSPTAVLDPAGGHGPAQAAAELTVVDAFRAQAARTPDAPALDGPEGVVTYAELDRRSDAVAAGLARRGVGREDLVGLVVDRTSAGVCALWGILKAGAAYVPLDPGHPGARIAEILGEAAVALSLTGRHLAEELAPFVPGTLLAVEDLLEGAPGPDAPAAAVLRPADLAYVIHTSGSTGRPKGVQIEHGSLMGFVRWMTGVCRVTGRTRFGFASSYAFDISCFPLFLPLLAGGTVVLAPGAPSPAALRALVAEHRADTLALTPSHLALLGAASGGPTHRLRTLLLGGEPLTPTAVRSAHAAFGADCRVINAYGPTEATVAVLAHPVAGDEDGATVPIGLPGPYAEVDLVTEDGDAIGSGPADTGRTGEIVIRGTQVARGYLGPPDGRPSPFTTGPDGVRAYRTGDLGRRLADGGIEFAGRIDEQVKIAGHRVDPAEVVAALEAHPAVHRAVVAPRRRPHSTAAVLCAYVLPEATADPAVRADLARALRAELSGTLPAYLVPAHVLVIDTLPSTVSGKADLDALPDPFAHTEPVAPPHATLEARVRHHWAEILGVDSALLTADSDFHALGGDSLALVEMLTAVSSDLLTPGQAQRFTGRLDCLVRNLTLGQVCTHLTAAREEAAA
ncbi:amino acid adenylation domain-containing protein [Streptomyces sp. NRRL S-241]|uniref:amino acid adenylation domain-containing protein n=1 Tax=Streptomyces sp. NRRL S-241 TaxID=1463896 RepID=UPI000691147F|nr:amino acid adenylation domain-containing protein [Streptomyces sp. NRRL S-241]